MTVCVVGLWHLGTVTAACCAAAGFTVVGCDADAAVVARLSAGVSPISEPGLDALVTRELAAGRLRFTTDLAAAVRGADVVWIAIDTPVDDDDQADVEAVVALASEVFPSLGDGATLLVSSQVPVGTTRRLARIFAGVAGGRQVSFAYAPENLRLGGAIDAMTRPERIVAGVEPAEGRARLAELFGAWTQRIEWMSIESAEMSKHALNSFLATSVAFINEIAVLCEESGADAGDVARALKSEGRIGPRAYLSPGAAFAGGTLARDIQFLSGLASERGLDVQLLRAVKSSNDAHRLWVRRRLQTLLNGVRGKVVTVWGLTYKPGSDTLRRSTALDLCRWLSDEGATVRVHDPVVRALPPADAARIEQYPDPVAAAAGAPALVVATPWPEYRDVDVHALKSAMARPLVLDAASHLAKTAGAQAGIEYVTVGAVRA